jgi:hypothetical protein
MFPCLVLSVWYRELLSGGTLGSQEKDPEPLREAMAFDKDLKKAR